MALSLSSDAPPAVPKVSLHEDARSEVIHVWREWRHRQMLKQFKEAVSKSSERERAFAYMESTVVIVIVIFMT